MRGDFIEAFPMVPIFTSVWARVSWELKMADHERARSVAAA
jgi:hypothetical protein